MSHLVAHHAGTELGCGTHLAIHLPAMFVIVRKEADNLTCPDPSCHLIFAACQVRKDNRLSKFASKYQRLPMEKLETGALVQRYSASNKSES